MIESTFGFRTAAFVLPLLLGVSAPAQFNRTSPAGANLSPLTYYSPEWVFTDLFRAAAPWWSQEANGYAWQTSVPLSLDQDGWVKSLQTNQAAGTLLCRDLQGHYPGGSYAVLYDGDGDLQISFDGKIVAKSTGRIDIQVSPTNSGIYIKLVRTNPQNYLRNIRVVQPAYLTRTSGFHPRFLSLLQPFRVLRCMDFQRTNNSTVQHWSQRTTPSRYTQDAPGGVAIEHIVDLCNETGADGWLCIPHLATDDYVRQCATLVRDRLQPGRKVWIEYSNEVWNTMFTQYAHASQRGLALGLSTNPYEAMMRYYAQRSVEIFAIWTQVFGGKSRLVRVLAAQNANPWLGEQIMEWQKAYQSADVLAVAPYFGGGLGDPATQTQVQTWSVLQVLQYCHDDIRRVSADTQQNGVKARAHGLRLVAYEGGQHLVGRGGAENNQQLTALFHASNRHPWMTWLTRYHFGEWLRAGGSTFVYYNSTNNFGKWGAWGAMEYQDQDPLAAPKYFALLEFAWWNPQAW